MINYNNIKVGTIVEVERYGIYDDVVVVGFVNGHLEDKSYKCEDNEGRKIMIHKEDIRSIDS